MTKLPATVAELIKALDEETKVEISDIREVLTEEARLTLAAQMGKRQLVNYLKLLLNHKD